MLPLARSQGVDRHERWTARGGSRAKASRGGPQPGIGARSRLCPAAGARDRTRADGARYAALGVLDEEKRELERFLHVGIDERTRRAIGPLPRGRGVLGELIRQPKALRLADVGEHPRSYGFPAGHPPMKSFLGVPITIRGEAFGNLYLTEKVGGGGEFDDLDERSVVVLADWAAVAIENARLYQSEHRRKLELERAVSGLEATTAIARALGGETDVDKVLDLIVKRGRALVEARWAAVKIVDGESSWFAPSRGSWGRTRAVGGFRSRSAWVGSGSARRGRSASPTFGRT